MKQIGPRTVPWGIPGRTGDQLDDEPFTTTHCVLPLKIWPWGAGLEEEVSKAFVNQGRSCLLDHRF